MSKRAKKQGFLDFLKKIQSLALSGIGVKQNFLWSFKIFCENTACVGKI